MKFQRYAIFFAPKPGSAFARFGAAWLGHDPALGRHTAAVNDFDISPKKQKKITGIPRRYGLHGTLKAPFVLKSKFTRRDLLEALEVFAQDHKPVKSKRLRLEEVGGFLALCPKGGITKINRLAAECVGEFDSFCKPAGKTGIDRFKSVKLNRRQKRLLERWGYPYVFDEYRFHITLTGTLSQLERTKYRKLLKPHIKPFTENKFQIKAISLFGDPGEGDGFQLIERFPLSE